MLFFFSSFFFQAEDGIRDLVRSRGLGDVYRGQTQVHADAGYVGVEKREEIAEEDPTGRIDWQIAKRRGPIKKMAEGPEKDLILAEEKAKASVRAFVEHPFHILKNLFRHRKTRYRGLAKNYHQLQVLFGLGNLVVAARKLV